MWEDTCACNEYAATGKCVHQTKRVSRMDVRDLGMMRRAILTVIDDGCNCDSGEKHPWEFYEDTKDLDDHDAFTEDMANQQRLRFCDAIQSAILKEIGPDESELQAAMKSAESLQPVEIER